MKTSWKTTLAGVIGAAVILTNKYSGLDLPLEVVVALVIGVVALVAGDYDNS